MIIFRLVAVFHLVQHAILRRLNHGTHQAWHLVKLLPVDIRYLIRFSYSESNII